MAFSPDVRILQFSAGPRRRQQRVCVLWPAWTYRVIAPALQERGLDLFERAVLALCRTGIRQPDRLGQLLELDPRLCAHIVDRALASGLLDEQRGPTDAGLSALRSGSLAEPAQWRVCYVFQDPFRQQLWPRTVDRLSDAWVVARSGDEVEILVGGAGRDHQRVRRIAAPPDTPQRPSAARVVEAASADRAARRVYEVREMERRNGVPPSGAPPAGTIGAVSVSDGDERPELRRVSFIGEPEPVYLLGFLEVAGEVDVDSGEGWVAHDPFGLGPSEVFHDLVYRYGRGDEHLSVALRERSTPGTHRVRERFRKASDELIEHVERNLVHEFGTTIRADPDAFDQMRSLDLACVSADRDESLEHVAHIALRLYEVLLRRVAHAYPLSEADLAEYTSATLRRATLEQVVRQVGFQRANSLFANVSDKELKSTLKDPSRGFVKALITLCLLAAADRPDHPVRRLAERHPDLLGSLLILNELRNRSAHGSRDPGPRHDAEWCRAVGAAAAGELLRVPPPTPERTAG
jgi:hypothetical protein